MTIASAYTSFATEVWYKVLSGVKCSGAVQLMGAISGKCEPDMALLKPKSPRRARGGWLSLIRIFDCTSIQREVTIDNHGDKTYPSNAPVY